MMSVFDELRRQNADWYIAHPATSWDEATWERAAQQTGLAVDKLRQLLFTSHVEMTCPLCGRPQPYLIDCKGCGSNAWGWEHEAAHGTDFADRVRGHLRGALFYNGFSQGQIEHACQHALTMGGCMVCRDCWVDASLEWEAYSTCPLALASEHVLTKPFAALTMALWNADAKENWPEIVQDWGDTVWRRWVENAHQWISADRAESIGTGPNGQDWAVAPEAEVDQVVVDWRAALLQAAAGENWQRNFQRRD